MKTSKKDLCAFKNYLSISAFAYKFYEPVAHIYWHLQ